MKNKINKTVICCHEKGTLGQLREQAKKDGFGDNIRNWQIWKRFQKDLKNIDIVEKIIKENKLEIKDRTTFYRFWSKVYIKQNTFDCWHWSVATDPNGYGVFNPGKPETLSVKAHRKSYELSKGNIPDGVQVQHLCNNPTCCNPNHLTLGNQFENIQYAIKHNGWDQSGENNNASKLTEDQVRNIHKLFKELLKLHPEWKHWQIISPIAQKFGISIYHANEIISGNYWKKVHKEFQNK